MKTRCGLAELQPVIDAARVWLRTLMKDARGGLVRLSRAAVCRLRTFLRHTPRRSNLVSSLRAVKRRWKSVADAAAAKTATVTAATGGEQRSRASRGASHEG